jgi:hypothetical protein
LTRLLAARGGVSRRYLHQIASIYAGGVMRAPFCWAERLRVSRRVRAHAFHPAPIFIVGHWRSGTTFLHNLLSRDLQFCFPTILDALRPFEFFPSPFDFISRTLLLASLPDVRPMDDVPLSADLPQEDEVALAAMGAPSFFNCFYFPSQMSKIFAEEVLGRGISAGRIAVWRDSLRCYLAKVSIAAGGRQLLIKNPAHSARIAQLSAMFPDARFIHVHRDPGEVLMSTRKLYRTMLPLVAFQDYQLTDVERHIAWSYPALMDSLIDGLQTLPPSAWVDVAYDDLVRSPLDVAERVYSELGLAGFEQSRNAMQTIATRGRSALPPDAGDQAFAERTSAIASTYRARLAKLVAQRLDRGAIPAAPVHAARRAPA